ncbi:unnamed protein product [Lactuca saligna]|uniref:Uncharacterized protein n=1 Tax=Lactuca saligna TaxID=75948 RepID=A0AA35YEJ3_LACSI|nr:unnamed protein product [Lactuca saligna]
MMEKERFLITKEMESVCNKRVAPVVVSGGPKNRNTIAYDLASSSLLTFVLLHLVVSWLLAMDLKFTISGTVDILGFFITIRTTCSQTHFTKQQALAQAHMGRARSM